MPRPITYLATHYPAVSHTFIADEIDALEQLGVDVATVSINSVGDADAAADSKQRRATTTYLKSLPKWRVLATVAATLLRHPSLLAIPLRTGARGVRATLWSYFQLAEAIMTYRVMRRSGSHHLHAHFGQAPATVAWLTTQVAHRHRTGRTNTWSMTIHGWHEFANEREARLREKVADASFVVAVSDFTRSQLFRIADTQHRDKIHVVRCGVDLTRFSARSDEPSNPRPRIAIVARVSAEKGHSVLVDAVATMHRRGLDVIVDVVGPEVDEVGAHVRSQAETAGISDALVWHGALPPDGVAGVLAQANVFCLPTFAEGLPVVIMEAMARGVPVVTTYIAGIPELAVDHTTALVVPAARGDLLADALTEVLSDDALRHRMVTAAGAAVRQQHDIAQNAQLLAQLFRQHGEGAS
ncbi:MAG: glycosyltransferase family 4 protein [Actinomycetia bacterium]|nr:glycosyltransferase family 4 protein [Actinomycetes bacterium]